MFDFDLDDSALLEALATVDPNASASDSVPPPEDGIYKVTITGAPIDKNDNPFKGKIVKPFTIKKGKEDTFQPKLSRDGKQDATLYLKVKVFEGDRALTGRTVYLNSMLGDNGTSAVLDLAKALGFVEGTTVPEIVASIKDFIRNNWESIKENSDVTATAVNINWLLTEALAAQIRAAGDDGLSTTATLRTTLMVDSGKKDGNNVIWDKVLVGSAKIKEKGLWKGGVFPGADGKSYRLELDFLDFGKSLD